MNGQPARDRSRFLGLALASLAGAGAAAATPAGRTGFTILTPGFHHASEVPEGAAGAWWELCLEGEERSSLRRTEVALVPVVDPLLDEGGARTGRDVRPAGCAGPLLLLRVDAQVSGTELAEGPLVGGFVDEPGTDESWWERPQRSVEASFLGRPLVVHGRREGEGYALELAYEGRRQRIFAAPRADAESWASWSVRWAGDLDRDGRPDLLVEASDHYNALETRLFLSSAAGKGRAAAPANGRAGAAADAGAADELVREVARSTTLGC